MPRLDRESVQPLLATLAAFADAPSALPDAATTGSLGQWLSTNDISTLPAIADAVRRQIRWGWQYGEPSSTNNSERRALQRQITALTQLPANGLLTGLLSFHGSGYVREAAVARLIDCSDGSEVPFLLLRCNDWVGAIAKLAQDGVRARLRPDYAEPLLRSYRLIEALQAAQRNALSPLLNAVRSTLQQPAAWPVLRRACAATDKCVRRAAYLLLAEALIAQPDGADLPALRHHLLQALGSPDLWLRIWAARVARRQLYGRALVDVLAAAQHDRSAPVRREALLAFLDDHPELRRSLLDPCAGLRGMVRFYLRKSGPIDFAAIYRHELSEAWQLDCQASTPATVRRVCIALDGLGETATAEGVTSPLSSRRGAAPTPPIDDSLLYDLRPRIRRSALRMLVRLDRSEGKEASIGALRAALADPAPGVLRCALEILSSDAGNAPLLRLGPDEIWQAFSRRGEPGARRRLLQALTQFGRWTRLGYLLRACHDDDDQVAGLARRAVERALHGQLYSGPSPTERARIEESLPRLQDDAQTRALGQRVRSALACLA